MRITKYIGTFIVTALCIAAFVAGSPQDVNAAGYSPSNLDDKLLNISVYSDGKEVSSGVSLVSTDKTTDFTLHPYNGHRFVIERTPGQATEDQTATFNLMYDYNGDGKYSSNESVRTITYYFPACEHRRTWLSVSRKAVKEYGTSSYLADMWAISAYVYKHFDYSMTSLKTYNGDTILPDCSTGANIARTWSSYTYKKSGSFKTYNTGHMSFVADDGTLIDVAGHLDAPGTDEYNDALHYYELQVESNKKKGK